jgi:hypothetical protein
MSSMYARSAQESPHTRAPHGRTVRRTSNGYKDHLKHVGAVRKSQARTIHPTGPDGPRPVNMEY